MGVKTIGKRDNKGWFEVHDLPDHSTQLCNKVIKPPNSMKIATHLNLKVGLMFPSIFLVAPYLFGKRYTLNLTMNELSRFCLHTNAGNIDRKILARCFKIFNITLENTLLCQSDFISQFEGTT